MRQDVKQGLRVLFIGTPCQVAAARRAVNDADNLRFHLLIEPHLRLKRKHHDFLWLYLILKIFSKEFTKKVFDRGGSFRHKRQRAEARRL